MELVVYRKLPEIKLRKIFRKIKLLREKLQEACDHPEMVIRMKNQAADFICEKYNWDEVVKETMKLYRRK